MASFNPLDVFSNAGGNKAAANTYASPYTNVGAGTNLGGYTDTQRKDFYSSNPTAQQWQQVIGASGVPYGAIAADYNSMMGTDINPLSGLQSIYGLNTQDVSNTLMNTDPAQLGTIAGQLGLGPADLASWAKENMGMDITPEQAANYLGMGAGNSFNIPMNTFPSSSSSNSSASRSGIDWNSDLGKAILPQLIEAAAGLPGLANSITPAVMENYTNLLQQANGPQGFQGTINDLAGRGILNSTVASDTMAGVQKNMTQDIQNKGFDAILAGLMAKLQVPGILGGIAGLAQTSTSSGGGSSQQSNPLAPYELALSFINNQNAS